MGNSMLFSTPGIIFSEFFRRWMGHTGAAVAMCPSVAVAGLCVSQPAGLLPFPLIWYAPQIGFRHIIECWRYAFFNSSEAVQNRSTVSSQTNKFPHEYFLNDNVFIFCFFVSVLFIYTWPSQRHGAIPRLPIQLFVSVFFLVKIYSLIIRNAWAL